MMRDAKAANHWASALTKTLPDQPVALHIRKHPLFVPQQIDFKHGITAFCGPNGVGKTRLVRLIARLCMSQPLEHAIDAELVIERRSGEQITVPATTHSVPVMMLDPGLVRDRVASVLGKIEDLEDLLPQYSPMRPAKHFEDDVRRTLGRGYNSIEVFDLTDLATDGQPLPYIRVADGPFKYDMFDMGAGELTAILTLWSLRFASPTGVLVLEEPETYLSPRTQQNLLDVIAREVEERKISTIITSHSPEMFSRLPLTHIRLLRRTKDGVHIVKVARELELREEVGLRIPKRGVMLMEDDVAAQFMRSIMRAHGFPGAKEYLIEVASGGESHVAKASQFPAAITKDFHQLSILDGDLRHQYSAPNLFFLPGDVSPDRLLLDQLISCMETVVETYGLAPQQAGMAMTACEGMDPHDALRSFADRLDVSPHSLREFLFSKWVATHAAVCDQLLTDIETYVGTLQDARRRI